MARNPVGYHVSATGGIRKAVDRAESIGCDALQIFPSNPRGWAVPAADPEGDEEGRACLAEAGYPLLIHAPYLVNLAASDRSVFAKSRKSLRYSLERGARLGALGVVVHAGSAGSGDVDKAVAATADAAVGLVEAVDGIDLVFELTAGGGNPVASMPADTKRLWDACDRHPRIRFCLDTQHLYAAGFDWTTRDGPKRLIDEIDGAVGIERIACFHVNDSKTGLGSRHDRHAVLGTGEIGVEPFERLFSKRALKGIPLILETPGELEEHASEVDLLRQMVS